MSKPRSPSSQRDCAFRKGEREQMKREKAALKRQRRESNKCATKPLTPDAVWITEADAQRSDDQDACFSLRRTANPRLTRMLEPRVALDNESSKARS